MYVYFSVSEILYISYPLEEMKIFGHSHKKVGRILLLTMS